MPPYRSAERIELHDTGIVLVRSVDRARHVGKYAFPVPSVVPQASRGRHIKFGLSEDFFTQAPVKTERDAAPPHGSGWDVEHLIHALAAFVDAAQVLHITIYFMDPAAPQVPPVAPQQMRYAGRYTVWWSEDT